MKYEIRKILSCKVLVISLVAAFIFGLFYSYNAYVRGNTINSEYKLCTGVYSEEKYQILENKIEKLQNSYDESQSQQTMDEMFAYLDLFGDAQVCKSVIEFRDNVSSDSAALMESESGYYQRLNMKINKLYGKIPELTIGKSQALKGISDVFCVSEIVDIAFVIVLILFSAFLFLNEHKCNTYIMIKSSFKGGNKTYWNKMMVAFIFTVLVSFVQTLSMTLLTLCVCDIDQWRTVILLDDKFIHSPYDFSVFEMVAVVTVMRTIGYLVLMSCFICVSLLFSKNIVPIAINTLIGIGGFAVNYLLSGKYYAISGGVIREAQSYHLFRKYTPFPLISGGIDYLKEYEPMNIFGYPVSTISVALLSNLMITIFVIAIGCFIYDTNFRQKGV